MLKRYHDYCAVIPNKAGVFVGGGFGLLFFVGFQLFGHYLSELEGSSLSAFWGLWIICAIILGLLIRLLVAFLMRLSGKKVALAQKRQQEKERAAWKKHQWKMWLWTGGIVLPLGWPGFSSSVRSIVSLGVTSLFLGWMGFFYPKDIYKFKKGTAADKINRGSFIVLRVMAVLILFFVLWLIKLESSRN